MNHPVLGCKCVEGRLVNLDGSVKFLPPVHDCEYIKQRNEAIDRVKAELGPEPKDVQARAEWSTRFDRRFSEEMARVLKLTGLLAKMRPLQAKIDALQA